MKEKIIVKIGGEEVEENYYKVTEDGKIYSIRYDREIGSKNTQGYVQVKLRMKNKNEKTGTYEKTFKRHRIVAEYFLADYSSDKVVEHRNRLSDDDRVNNLILKGSEEIKLSAKEKLIMLKKRRERLEKELESVNMRIKELEK